MGVIVDQYGNPCQPKGCFTPRAKGVYSGARHLDTKTPWHTPYKPEDEAFLADRHLVTARSFDAYRNDPMIKGVVDDKIKLMLGNRWSIRPMPDAELLGWTSEEARDFARVYGKMFNMEFMSRNKFMDAAGRNNGLQLLKLSGRNRILSGETYYKINRFEARRAPHNFNLQLISSGRIDTPAELCDRKDITAGIQMSDLGFERAYYVHKYHVGSNKNAYMKNGERRYVRVPRFNAVGQVQMIHSYDQTHIDLTRGISQVAPVIISSKQKSKMIDSSLVEFIAKSSIALVIKSDAADIAEAFDLNDSHAAEVKEKTMSNIDRYMNDSADWHDEMNIHFGDNPLLRLYDGEELDGFSPEAAGGSLKEFHDIVSSREGRAFGFSREAFSQAWNDTNYSGARAGQLSVKRTVEDEREFSIDETYQIYCAHLEDAILSDRIRLPNTGNALQGYDFYLRNKEALTLMICEGPAWDEIDQSKTAQRYLAEGKIGVGTLERYCRQVLGENYQDVLDQKQREFEAVNQRLENLQLPLLTDFIAFAFPDWDINAAAEAFEQSNAADEE